MIPGARQGPLLAHIRAETRLTRAAGWAGGASTLSQQAPKYRFLLSRCPLPPPPTEHLPGAGPRWGGTHLKAKPVCLLRENGQGGRVQDQEPVPLLLRGGRRPNESPRECTRPPPAASRICPHPQPSSPRPAPCPHHSLLCAPPTCEGRCCSLTLEAQMALPTAWHPDAVRTRVSLRCRVQGSSSSGGPW